MRRWLAILSAVLCLAALRSEGSRPAFDANFGNELTSVAGTACSYDASGNITGDGTRYYSYDDENQLTQVIWGSGNDRTGFAYDGLGRVRKRTEYYYSAGVWTWNSEVRLIYDGRRVIQERNSSNAPTVAYTRGLDLSGSFEGAGGIGGMIARSHGYSAGNWSTHHAYHADGGGNITAMISTAQAISARYTTIRRANVSTGGTLLWRAWEAKYDPFGNQLTSSGTMAGVNLYRFSSKEFHPSTGLYYYGYRFYLPAFQRWLNQDPLGETGGINLYTFCNNSPLRWVDIFGLAPGDPYKCDDDAALAALNDSLIGRSIREDKEYGGRIYRNPDGTYSYTKPGPGRRDSQGRKFFKAPDVPKGKEDAGIYHRTEKKNGRMPRDLMTEILASQKEIRIQPTGLSGQYIWELQTMKLKSIRRTLTKSAVDKKICFGVPIVTPHGFLHPLKNKTLL